MIDEVVVLPWVPATTTDRRWARNSSDSSAGNEVSGSLRSCAASTSMWSLRQTLPTTTRSGDQSRLLGPNPSKTGIPWSASWVDMGG